MAATLPIHRYDAIVIGSGLAGLAFAIEFSKWGRVCVLTKAATKEANTSYAQGGIAAAVGEADDWKLHEQDTLKAGAGLCDPEAVRTLVSQAPEAIEWLRSLGAQFTTGTEGGLELGLEGGHSRRRIVHFEDRTGWEIERAMVEAVRKEPGIDVVEHAFATKLLVDDRRCFGTVAELQDLGPAVFTAQRTLLATGGCGQLFANTTNPRVATGDGIALAIDAGAAVSNMEFMQFHPTALYHEQLRGFLITEAARGAGGTLRNHRGRRFMFDYDGRLELAPRDVVARSIVSEMEKLDTWCVYLDLAHLPGDRLESEFPTIYAKLREVGLEIEKQWIPIVPAQHYSCGGVTTDLQGRTDIHGLYAAGEVASTGVHGANRLASNSLLEAIVFARAAARAEKGETATQPSDVAYHPPRWISETDAVAIRKKLQHVMTERVGILRSDAGLVEAKIAVANLAASYAGRPASRFGRYSAETRNLLVAAEAVVGGALARKVNVGLHYNVDQAHSE